MKSRVLNISIGSSIFILLIISVLAVIRPAYERLNLFLSREEFKYAVLFKEKTGLRFSYKSLSPSIFSFVNIRGIEVYDDSTGEKIVEIKRAVLSYKFSEFFKQNPENLYPVPAGAKPAREQALLRCTPRRPAAPNWG